MEFGKAIAGRRKKLGIKQKAFAARIGISANALCAIELGKSFPSNTVLTKILDGLGLDIMLLPRQMTLYNAIKIAKEMQLWRRGEPPYDGDTPETHRGMPYGTAEWGEALDTLIQAAECLLNKKD